MTLLVNRLFPILFLLIVTSTALFIYQPPPPFSMPTTTTTISAAAARAAARAGRGQLDLVNRLRREGVIAHKEVQTVMDQVDRKNYIARWPYDDSPQSIQCGQTISAPHMHAYALETMLPNLLQSPRPEVKMLDVGCGSGYLTATMGRWVHPIEGDTRILPKTGKVYGMDIYPDLVDLTRQNLRKDDGDLLDSGVVQLKTGNGWDGWPEAAPFDAIHVGAAAADFPVKLANQLALGGVMVIPIGPDGGFQYLYKIERVAETGNADSDFKTERLLGVRYVPLINQPGPY